MKQVISLHKKLHKKKFLKLIKEISNITKTQMATALGLTHDGISYNSKQMKESNIIERVGATKNGKWIIKN